MHLFCFNALKLLKKTSLRTYSLSVKLTMLVVFLCHLGLLLPDAAAAVALREGLVEGPPLHLLLLLVLLELLHDGLDLETLQDVVC